MSATNCTVFTLAPYKILPANTGGQLSIACLHDAMGKLCENHLIGTVNNGPAEGYAFQLHRLLSAHPVHYLPLYKLNELTALARQINATHIFCEHPYMAPTAVALARRLGLPWYLRGQNIESLRFKTIGKPWWRIMHWFERWAMRRANGVFFITREDKDWAIANYGVNPVLSHVIPYGTAFAHPPEADLTAKSRMAITNGLNPNAHWFYFLGVQSYKPNADAVRYIVNEVVPRLHGRGLNFQVLIGGKGLPEELQLLVATTNGVVKYLGFIEHLDPFIKACSTMLNPVITGGGIKTKAVEALGYNKTVVSTINGAAGIAPEYCGDNLLLSADGDWDEFANNCMKASESNAEIPALFYEHYYWGALAEQVVDIMNAQKSA